MCIYHANDDPSTWTDQLENYFNNQLDIIFLVVPADEKKFNDTAEFITFNREKFDWIMSHWSRHNQYIDISSPIVDLIYNDLANVYKTKQIYTDFLSSNFQFG